MHGFMRHNDVFVFSMIDDEISTNVLFLYHGGSGSIPTSLSWRKGFFKNKGLMKYMDLRDDTATPAPMNKIIFGCMESTLNPNIFYFMRLISV